MAITWRTKISVLDMKRGNVSVILERVDDADLENIKILNTCSILDGLLNTSKLKQQILTELKRQYQEQEKNKKKYVATIETFEKDIVDAAKTWET